MPDCGYKTFYVDMSKPGEYNEVIPFNNNTFETGSNSTDSSMLLALFLIAIDNSVYNGQVIFDVDERPTDLRKPPQLFHVSWTKYEEPSTEIAAQKWVDISYGKAVIALLNKTKYGDSCGGEDLRITLLRSAGYHDEFPNLVDIRYSLFPHAGDWKNGVWAISEDFNISVYIADPPSFALAKEHAKCPEEASFFSVDTPGVVLVKMKKVQKSNRLKIKLLEIAGKEFTLNLKIAVELSLVRRLNLIKLSLENANQLLMTEQSRLK